MSNIIKSALYKLSKDWTFKIILIIGAAMAVFMNALYAGIGALDGNIGEMCNGQSLYLSSLSPTQNFGLAVPINLIIFTIGEFNCGTIRNKIIAGHRKISIYFSLLLIGLIFTISVMAVYFGLSVGIASIIGGFDVEGVTTLSSFRPEYLYQIPLMALATYIFIVSLTICVCVAIRSIGGVMPIVMLVIMFLYFAAFIPTTINLVKGATEMSWQAYINPLYTFGSLSIISVEIDTTWFILSMVCPLVWSVIFFGLGVLSFKKSDIK